MNNEKKEFFRKIEREKSRFRMPNHKPGQLHWDETDARFLVVEAVYQNPEIVGLILNFPFNKQNIFYYFRETI